MAGGKPRSGSVLGRLFHVMRDPALSPGAKTLWAIYQSYDVGNGAFPSDQTLAGHMDMSTRMVQTYRAELMKKGFLQQRLRGPNTASYTTTVLGEDTKQTSKQATKNTSKLPHQASNVVPKVVSKNTSNRGGIEVSFTKNTHTDACVSFLNIYPKRHGNPANEERVQQALSAALNSGATADVILDGAKRYARFCNNDGVSDPKYIIAPETWITGRRWEDVWSAPHSSTYAHVAEPPVATRPREFEPVLSDREQPGWRKGA